jgi:hypothetical protein
MIVARILQWNQSHGVAASVSSEKKELRFRIGVGIGSRQEPVKLIAGRLDIDSTGRVATVRVRMPLALEANTLGVERT